MKLIFLLFIVLLQVTLHHCFVSHHSRPHYIECQSSAECGSVACCVIGNARYSLPRCQPLLIAGEVCTYASYNPLNTTVIYPDGAEVKLMNVHRTFCPCEAGLACGPEGTCYDPTLSRNYNSIDSDIYDESNKK